MCWGLGLGASRLALPGRSAWLPGSWAALVYRCPEEEGPSEHWRESPLRPASHSEGAHQDSGRGDRAEGGCRDELERASEAAPGPRAALCPPARAATRSQQQEGADEGCGAPATPPPVARPLCNASGRRLWGGTQRKRRDGANRIRTVGPEPRACTGPTARPAQWAVAASRAACPLVAANFHDTAWGTGQGRLDRFRLEFCSTGHSRAAGKGPRG